jgi:trimeric autotransporter adhesin
MTKNSNRKGLALGAIFALVSSLFVTAPAAQANETGLVVAPIAGTSYTMVNTEDFILTTRLGSQVQADRAATLKYIVAKSGTAGYGLSVSNTVSATAVAPDYTTTFGDTMSSMITTSTISVVVPTSPVAGIGGSQNQLRLQLWSYSALTSVSPSTTVTVTAFLDLNGDNEVTGTEPSTVVTVTFVPTSAMGAAVTLTAPNAGDLYATASATLGTVNHQQLAGQFRLALASTGDTMTNALGTFSAAVSPADLAAGNFSASQAIRSASASPVASVSAVLHYGDSTFIVSEATVDTIVASSKLGVASVAAGTLALTVVNSDHATGSAQAVTVRPNQTYTVRVHAKTGAVSQSDVAVTIKFAGSTGLVTGSKTVSINGGAELTTYPASVTVTTGADGYATWTMKTSGFVADNAIKVQANVGNTRAGELTMTTAIQSFRIINDHAIYTVAPGGTVSLGYTVRDQWDVVSARADQRIAVTRGGTGFNYAETLSYVAVAAGKATFAFTPAPATKTGSATVATVLQHLNADTGTWVDQTLAVASVNSAVTVTSVASTFSARSVVSQSASVSYFPSTVSYKSVAVTVTNAGESVSVTGPAALIFRQDGTTATASGALTIRANASGVATLNVASLLEGSHTITFTVGAVSTTSLLVVDPAAGNSGTRVTFDKSSIVSGETSTITGKVTDANGNPVNTTTDGSAALVVVSYAGKGLPFNTGSTIETDEKGEFKVNVLALPGDVGTGTLTATYRPAGAAVDTKNVTGTQVITIVAPAAVAAPEINAVIGSFNGRWAVRVENAKGAVVSVKVGNRWVKYTSLNDNYLFSRKSTVGATLPVAVYVNGQLENVATLTIK